MASEKSFIGNEMQKSNSIIEYCIQFDDSNDNISKLKGDNFNLRLRCYNMSLALDKCKCSKDNSNVESSINTSITKMDTFLDNQKELKTQNLILREENEMLKFEIHELKESPSQLFEINSLKLKCEQLTNLLNGNIPGNDMLQYIIKTNDELLKLNIQTKQELSRLQLKNYYFKKKFIEMSNLPMVSSESKIFHSALQKEFNESLETSQRNTEGCSQCNTLKVNYEKITEILTQFFEEYENLTKDLKSKDSIIIDLENKLQEINTKPVVTNEKLLKYKQLTKEALANIVKKDHEIIQIKKESKETIDYYILEMGKLNRKLAHLQKLCQDKLPFQAQEINTLSSLINEIFKHLPIKNEFDIKLIEKSIEFDEFSVSEAKKNWISIIKSVDLLRKYLMRKNIPQEKSVVVDIERNNNQSPQNIGTAQEDTGNVSMKFILNKFNEVKELSDSFREFSFNLNSSYAESHEYQNDGKYSPQFRLGHISSATQHQNESLTDPFASIYYDIDPLNQTVYRSFIAENFNQTAIETLMQKIDELGSVIHKYSEIVSDINAHEKFKKVAILEKSVDNSFLEEAVNVPEVNQSQDLSVLKVLYHEETEKFKIEINTKEEIINNLREELSSFREKLEGYERCSLDIEHLQSKLVEYEKKIENLNSIMEKKNISNNLIIKELRFDLSESKCKMESLEAETKSQLVASQQEIKNLKSRNESLTRKINKLSEDLSYSIKETQNIGDDLRRCENEKSTLYEKIKELEINVNNLSEENEKLDRIIIEKQIILEDSLISMSNMTQSLISMTNQSETLSCNIGNIYNIMLAKKLIISPPELNKEAKDTIEILKLIEEQIIKSTSKNKEIKTTSNSLFSSEKRRCEVIERSNKLPASKSVSGTTSSSETKSQRSSLNDLTNITSFNTDTSESEGNVETIRNAEIDMTGFKINSIRDVVNNPEKVVIMLKKFVKDNGDLKRRLKGRYEENERLVQIIKSNNCISKVCETVEKLTEECAINNENVEKAKST